MNFLADVYLIPAKRQRTSPLISESDFDLASKLGTKHFVPKILKKVKFAGGGGGDADVSEAADAGDDGGDGYSAGGPPGPNTPVAGRSRAPTAAAADAETAATPAPRARSQSRLRQSSTAPPPSQQPPSTDAPPPSRSRSKSKGAPKASGSITGFHIRQNVGAAATALLRGATGAAAAVARAIPKPTESALGLLSPSGRVSLERSVPSRGRSPTPRNIIFQPGSPSFAAVRRSSSRVGGRVRAASAASKEPPAAGDVKQVRLLPPHSPVPAEKQEPKPKPADEVVIHAMKPVSQKEATPPIKARLRRTQSQAPPKAAAAAAPPLSLYGTYKGKNVIMGSRGGLTVETAAGGFRTMTPEEKEQIVKKTA